MVRTNSEECPLPLLGAPKLFAHDSALLVKRKFSLLASKSKECDQLRLEEVRCRGDGFDKVIQRNTRDPLFSLTR